MCGVQPVRQEMNRILLSWHYPNIFGAFVELAPGVDALLHVSQISQEHVEKPSDVLKIGQEVEAKIVDFNEEEKKISLSIKALAAPAEDAETEE